MKKMWGGKIGMRGREIIGYGLLIFLLWLLLPWGGIGFPWGFKQPTPPADTKPSGPGGDSASAPAPPQPPPNPPPAPTPTPPPPTSGKIPTPPFSNPFSWFSDESAEQDDGSFESFYGPFLSILSVIWSAVSLIWRIPIWIISTVQSFFTWLLPKERPIPEPQQPTPTGPNPEPLSRRFIKWIMSLIWRILPYYFHPRVSYVPVKDSKGQPVRTSSGKYLIMDFAFRVPPDSQSPVINAPAGSQTVRIPAGIMAPINATEPSGFVRNEVFVNASGFPVKVLDPLTGQKSPVIVGTDKNSSKDGQRILLSENEPLMAGSEMIFENETFASGRPLFAGNFSVSRSDKAEWWPTDTIYAFMPIGATSSDDTVVNIPGVFFRPEGPVDAMAHVEKAKVPEWALVATKEAGRAFALRAMEAIGEYVMEKAIPLIITSAMGGIPLK